MSSVLSHIRDVGVIPVIRAKSAETAEGASEALAAGGLTVVEITMTVPGALTAIAAVAERLGNGVALGAGTVTTSEMAKQAIDAGARFIVTPSLIPAVISAAHTQGVPVIAGALTPTEIVGAIDAGADWVKVFPVSAVGGPDYLRALRGPFPNLSLVPTGGVSLESIDAYIRAGAVAVGVGGELIRADAVARGDFAAIGKLGEAFIDAVRKARA